MTDPTPDSRMLSIIGLFEKIVVLVLLVLMMLAILLATGDLIHFVGKEILAPPRFMLGIDKVMNVFGMFFMILIGLELLETIKTYLSHEEMHVEIVFIVAMIAVARKVIILELSGSSAISAPTLFGIAALILALAAGHFLVRFAQKRKRS